MIIPMDWTTSPFYPPAVLVRQALTEAGNHPSSTFGRYAIYKAVHLAKYRSHTLLNSTLARGSRIFQAPSTGERIAQGLTRSSFGVGCLAVSAAILHSDQLTDASRVVNPVTAAILAAGGFYNGIVVSTMGASKSRDLFLIENKMIDEVENTKEHIDTLAFEYGPARAAISLATVLTKSEWNDPVMADLLAKKVETLLFGLPDGELGYCLRAIGQLTDQIDATHPHANVANRLSNHLDARSDFGNGTQHLGREM